MKSEIEIINELRKLCYEGLKLNRKLLFDLKKQLFISIVYMLIWCWIGFVWGFILGYRILK